MAMGKLHKDIGQLIVQSTEDPERSDSQVIKVRIPKTCLHSVVRNVVESLALTALCQFTGYRHQDKRDHCQLGGIG